MSDVHANALIAEFVAYPERLPNYIRAVEHFIRAVEHLLEDRLALLKLMPPCPVHGEDCSSYAREWIHKQLSRDHGPWWEE